MLEPQRTQIEEILGPEDTRSERERQLANPLAGPDPRLAEQQVAVKSFRSEIVDRAFAEARLRRRICR